MVTGTCANCGASTDLARASSGSGESRAVCRTNMTCVRLSSPAVVAAVAAGRYTPPSITGLPFIPNRRSTP